VPALPRGRRRGEEALAELTCAARSVRAWRSTGCGRPGTRTRPRAGTGGTQREMVGLAVRQHGAQAVRAVARGAAVPARADRPHRRADALLPGADRGAARFARARLDGSGRDRRQVARHRQATAPAALPQAAAQGVARGCGARDVPAFPRSGGRAAVGHDRRHGARGRRSLGPPPRDHEARNAARAGGRADRRRACERPDRGRPARDPPVLGARLGAGVVGRAPGDAAHRAGVDRRAPRHARAGAGVGRAAGVGARDTGLGAGLDPDRRGGHEGAQARSRGARHPRRAARRGPPVLDHRDLAWPTLARRFGRRARFPRGGRRRPPGARAVDAAGLRERAGRRTPRARAGLGARRAALYS